jgi:hypothetical protein
MTSRQYQVLSAQGVMLDVSAEDPVAAMRDAAGRLGPDDFPVTCYGRNEAGLWAPVWGGPRGLAGIYPPGESPEDAERLFGRGRS